MGTATMTAAETSIDVVNNVYQTRCHTSFKQVMEANGKSEHDSNVLLSHGCHKRHEALHRPKICVQLLLKRSRNRTSGKSAQQRPIKMSHTVIKMAKLTVYGDGDRCQNA